MNQKVMSMLCAKLGYKIDIAENGLVALDMIDRAWGRNSEQQEAEAAAEAATATGRVGGDRSAGGSAPSCLPYDVICMDVCLPVMDGLECTRRLRARQLRPSPVVIAHSADTTPEAQQRCKAAGMDSFLAKPIQLDELITQLRAAYAAMQKQKQKQGDSEANSTSQTQPTQTNEQKIGQT